MPHEIAQAGSQNVDIKSRAEDIGQQDATAILLVLKTKVAGKAAC